MKLYSVLVCSATWHLINPRALFRSTSTDVTIHHPRAGRYQALRVVFHEITAIPSLLNWMGRVRRSFAINSFPLWSFTPRYPVLVFDQWLLDNFAKCYTQMPRNLFETSEYWFIITFHWDLFRIVNVIPTISQELVNLRRVLRSI